MSYQTEITLTTKGHGDMHDLTEQVSGAVKSSEVKTGFVHVFNIGSTAAVGTIEFEPGLEHDLPAVLDSSFHPAGATATSRPGIIGTVTRICRPQCLAHP